MTAFDRRQFIQRSLVAGAATTLLSGRIALAASIDARVELFLDEPIGAISPNLYGHFTEHIGGVIYDGVWVGEKSRIPNKGGIRAELIDRMREIKAPIIRWPGGCFADSYDWQDGIGDPAKRPRRTNFWEVEPDAARLHEKGAQVFEPNSFGTDEFLRFCHLTGAEPYLAANLRSQSALSFDHWIEYCNSPAGSTTLAEMRAANGSRDPYGVQFWGVGNESWGCGGNFTPEEYASEFRRFTTWVPQYGVDLQLVGSGPNDNDTDWTHRFFEQIFTGSHAYRNSQFKGWSIHHYSNGWSRDVAGNLVRGKALEFDRNAWFDLLRESDETESILRNHWAVMGQFDPDHHVKLVVDEYGPWYREGTELDPTHIFGQQVTLRDALATALTLDLFNRNAEKVSIGTCAQLVNNINALFLCHEDRFLCTPNFHVFQMYAAHQNAEAVRTEFSAPNMHYERGGKSASFWSVNGSASRRGKEVTLSMVHTDIEQPKEMEIAIRGAHVLSATATTLTAKDIHSVNTFENPANVASSPLQCVVRDGAVYLTLPAPSVTSVRLALG